MKQSITESEVTSYMSYSYPSSWLHLQVLIIYSLVSDDDYMHSEAIVLGGSLMYALLLPTLVCSISQRYWHTVNKYRTKLGHRMVDPPKKPPENGKNHDPRMLTECA